MPVFTAKHNELKLQEQGQSSEGIGKIDMLGTIKLPKNMKLISGNLPESNYESDRPSKSSKKNTNVDRIESILDEIVEVNEPDRDDNQNSANKRQHR
jgi:hypothetical protein